MECSKCGVEMVEGFVLDRGDHNTKSLQTWVAGAPEKSFWTGIKSSNKETYSVAAHRCGECGRLEFFAASPVKI